MPSLSDTIRSSSPAGYAPAPPALSLPSPVSLPGQSNSFRVNPNIRCPIPPTSAGPDTLRQFNDGDAGIPRRRILPLPASTPIGGGGSSVTNNTVVNSSSSGGSSSSGITAKTFSYTSPLVAAGGTVFQTLGITAKSFQLVSISANGPCEVRMYGSSTAMAADSARPLDAPVAAEIANGLITDIALDASPFQWFWENRVGCNSDSPQTTNLYFSVTNLSGAPSSVRLNIILLPLESA
jgi:hypothetical protein